MIKMIWCEDKNHGIGLNGVIPWSYKQDMLFFKEKTLNHIVIMGKKTWDSLPIKPLKNRTNIVLTHDQNLKNMPHENCFVFHDIQEVFALEKKAPDVDIYIIGGKSLYEQFFSYAKQLFVTKLNKDYQCDTILNFNYDDFSEKLIFQNDDFTIYQYDRIK